MKFFMKMKSKIKKNTTVNTSVVIFSKLISRIMCLNCNFFVLSFKLGFFMLTIFSGHDIVSY